MKMFLFYRPILNWMIFVFNKKKEIKFGMISKIKYGIKCEEETKKKCSPTGCSSGVAT